MPLDANVKQEPSSVTQLAAAMAALGLYSGANTPAEHAAEARRLGGENAYRVRLANALLGAAQTEAILADTLPISPEARVAATSSSSPPPGPLTAPRNGSASCAGRRFASAVHSARFHRTSISC